MKENSIIRTKFTSTISLDKMWIDDSTTKTAEKYNEAQRGEKSGEQIEQTLGIDYPFVKINGYHFDEQEILFLEINEGENFLPTCTFIFKLSKTDAFSSEAFPKDGDLINVFIRAKNNQFRPIRADFIILDCDAGEGGPENFGREIICNGELFIPHINKKFIKSYNGTSYETLINLAKELKLGFATNETNTNDSQIWINTSNDYKQFIKFITKHSFKDTKSFFHTFVDIYYNLNFINVNNQLEAEELILEQIVDLPGVKGYWNRQESDIENTQQVTTKMLTNIEGFKNTNMFIRGYKTINNSSQIHKLYGYKTNIQFFDQKSKKYWDIFIEPITSVDENKLILRGRIPPKDKEADGKDITIENTWETENTSKWLGVQTLNVHNNWFFAKEWNFRNLLEIEKLYLEVKINNWNPNFYMFEKIPVLFMNKGDVTKANRNITEEELDTGLYSLTETINEYPVIDKFNSGFYVITSKKIIYEKSNTDSEVFDENPDYVGPSMKEIIKLSRREYPLV